MAVNKHIIDVQTKGAGKSEKQIKGVSGALGGLAKQAGIAAAAYFGSRALLGGIKSSIDAFARQELAEKKLRFAAGASTSELIKQAQALQQTTRFGDEAIIEAQALIGSFVKEEEAIAAATKATLDLAAAKGMDLTAAADLVSKTLGSSTNALSRYGIQVEGTVGSTERLNSLTENIADVFGGQATEQSKTLAGSLESMQNAIGDAAEALGETFAPLIIKVSGAVVSLAEGFQSLLNWQEKYDAHIEAQVKILTEAEIAQMAYNDAVALMPQQQILGEILKITDGFENMTVKEFEAAIANDEFKKSMDSFTEAGAVHADDLRMLVEQYIKLKNATDDSTSAEEKRQEMLKKRKQIMGDISNAVRGSGKLEQRVSQVNAIINTAEAITEFMSKGQWGRATLAGLVGANQVTTIEAQKFAKGANFITDGTTPMIVGEEGRELVQVTPLEGPNLEGPQGSNITLNVSGNVMTQDFVENQLLDSIKESLRLGGDIGSN